MTEPLAVGFRSSHYQSNEADRESVGYKRERESDDDNVRESSE